MFYLYGLCFDLEQRRALSEHLNTLNYPGTFESYTSATDSRLYWGHGFDDDVNNVVDPATLEELQDGLNSFPHIRNDIVSFVNSVAQKFGIASGTCYTSR